MTEYLRAKHPCPEQPDYNDEIDPEKLPGCGDLVLIKYEDGEMPPVESGDVLRDRCPSCKRHNARLEVRTVDA